MRGVGACQHKLCPLHRFFARIDDLIMIFVKIFLNTNAPLALAVPEIDSREAVAGLNRDGRRARSRLQPPCLLRFVDIIRSREQRHEAVFPGAICECA